MSVRHEPAAPDLREPLLGEHTAEILGPTRLGEAAQRAAGR